MGIEASGRPRPIWPSTVWGWAGVALLAAFVVLFAVQIPLAAILSATAAWLLAGAGFFLRKDRSLLTGAATAFGLLASFILTAMVLTGS